MVLASSCASTIDRLVSSGRLSRSGNGEEFAAAAQLLVQMQRLCNTLEASSASSASSTSLLHGSADGAGRAAATLGVSPPTRPLPSPLASTPLAALRAAGDDTAKPVQRGGAYEPSSDTGDMDELDDMGV